MHVLLRSSATIILWLPRVERAKRKILAFLLSILFCASGGFSRVPDAMELSVWHNSAIFEERITIASRLCLRLGATHAACVARSACFGLVPLSLPRETIYAFYASPGP